MNNNSFEEGNWKSLNRNPHPIVEKINYRFSSLYNGKLLIYDLNRLKQKLDDLKHELKKDKEKYYFKIMKLRWLIYDQQKLCCESSSCKTNLQEHLKKCKKCSKEIVDYDCQSGNNGRCYHYYEMERFKDEIEEMQYFIAEQEGEIYEFELNYKCKLNKYNGIDEFSSSDDDDWY